MTQSEAQTVLTEFPQRWESLQERRRQILESYGNGTVYQGGGRSYGHGDKTAKKATRLIEVEQQERLLGVVREWLTQGMDPVDRQIIINLWRGQTPSRSGQAAEYRFRQMVNGLIHFAGIVRGGHGPAYANTQPNSHPAW